MSTTRKMTTAGAIIFSVACAFARWSAATWQRSARLDLLLSGYRNVQFEDPGLHPDQLGTHTMTAAFVRAGGGCVGWVDMAGDVHLAAAGTGRAGGGTMPVQFILMSCEFVCGFVAVIFAVLSLPHIVLWGRRPAPAGFPVQMRNDRDNGS